MNRRLRTWLIFLGMLGMSLALLATPLFAADLGDLKIVDVDWIPRVVFPGEEVRFTVTYENDGAAAIEEEVPVTLRLVIQTRDGTEQEITQVEEILDSQAGLTAGAPATATVTFIAPGAGSYDIVVRLLANDRELARQNVPLEVESPLPSGVAQLFAGLGMFIAVLTIMALGTEIVIDSLKFFIGLKTKVTAMEAYDNLARELPGQLSELGVESAAVARFERVASDLRSSLQPVQDITDMYAQIKAGAFGEAYETLKQMSPDAGKITEAELAELTEKTRLALRRGFRLLRGQLNLPPEQTNSLEASLLALVDEVTVETAATLLEEIFSSLQEWVPQVTEGWLRYQIDALLSTGRSHVEARVENDLLPALESLGFNHDETKTKVAMLLDELEGAAHQSSLLYVQSLENLLRAVEERRNEMQSPLRKSYRRLRDSQFSFWAVVAGFLLGLLIFWVANRFLLTGFALSQVVEFLFSLLGGVVVGAIFALIINNNTNANGRKLGPTLRNIEHAYNRLLGRKQPKEMYGSVELTVTDQITGIRPTTAAQVLLEREDKHRDEEASRQRVLRVIALIVGIILAYLLQIDAAVLLDQAAPGVSRTVNAILNLSPQQLNRIWGALPDNNRLTAGIILTGLGASAGSAFWHAQLGRLQSIKAQSEEAAKVLRRARGLAEGED
jgi:hypothetical protein